MTLEEIYLLSAVTIAAMCAPLGLIGYCMRPKLNSGESWVNTQMRCPVCKEIMGRDCGKHE